MTRITGKKEIVRAALNCIAYQITDIIKAMERSSDTPIQELKAGGGPTQNQYLMQFQSDILGIPVHIPDFEELSGIGVAYVAGLAVGLYDTSIFEEMRYMSYHPFMKKESVRLCIADGRMR